MLKAIIDEAAFSALPDALKGAYSKGTDGRYAIQVEGMKPESEWRESREKLSEFRENNVRLLQENADLKTKVGKFETDFKDVDPAKYRELVDEADKMSKRGIKKTDDIEALVANAINAALKPVQDQLVGERTAREEAQRRADAATFRAELGRVATEKGVKPQRLRHLLRDAEEEFDFKDGKIAAKPGKLSPVDPALPLTPESWLDGLSQSDPDLFQSSNGGGAHHKGDAGVGGPRPGAKTIKIAPGQSINYRELGITEDQVIKGEVVIERA